MPSEEEINRILIDVEFHWTDFWGMINKIGATGTSKIIGCSLDTAKSWSIKRRVPSKWIQKLILDKLR